MFVPFGRPSVGSKLISLLLRSKGALNGSILSSQATVLLAGLSLVGCGSEQRGGHDSAREHSDEEIHSTEFPHDEGSRASKTRAEAWQDRSCSSWEGVTFPELSPSDVEGSAKRLAVFQRVWETLGQKYDDPTMACLDWPKVGGEFGQRAIDAADEKGLYAVIEDMLDLFDQSHLVAHPPPRSASSKASAKPSNANGPATVVLHPRLIEKKVLVNAGPLGKKESPIPVGSQLLKIRGQEVSKLVAEVNTQIEREYKKRKAPPAALATQVQRKIQQSLRCPEGGSIEIAFRVPKGEVKEEELACDLPKGQRLSFGHLRNLPVRVETQFFEQEKIGALHFGAWMIPVLPKIRSAIRSFIGKGAQALILDLRGNPGGISSMVIPVAKMLSDKSIDLGRLQMRTMTQNFAVDVPDEIKKADVFDGPVVVLVDEGSASTTEIFAMAMQEVGRIKVIASGHSAGAALPSLIEALPDGGRLQFVVGYYRSPQGNSPEGVGVRPDFWVQEGLHEIQSGSDPVFDAAKNYLKKELAKKN